MSTQLNMTVPKRNHGRYTFITMTCSSAQFTNSAKCMFSAESLLLNEPLVH